MRASLFLFFAGSWALLAQEANQGTITGFVYDQSQGVLREAESAATSQATGQVRSIKSDSDGVCTIAALQPGLYTVRVTAPGFKR